MDALALRSFIGEEKRIPKTDLTSWEEMSDRVEIDTNALSEE